MAIVALCVCVCLLLLRDQSIVVVVERRKHLIQAWELRVCQTAHSPHALHCLGVHLLAAHLAAIQQRSAKFTLIGTRAQASHGTRRSYAWNWRQLKRLFVDQQSTNTLQTQWNRAANSHNFRYLCDGQMIDRRVASYSQKRLQLRRTVVQAQHWIVLCIGGTRQQHSNIEQRGFVAEIARCRRGCCCCCCRVWIWLGRVHRSSQQWGGRLANGQFASGTLRGTKTRFKTNPNTGKKRYFPTSGKFCWIEQGLHVTFFPKAIDRLNRKRRSKLTFRSLPKCKKVCEKVVCFHWDYFWFRSAQRFIIRMTRQSSIPMKNECKQNIFFLLSFTSQTFDCYEQQQPTQRFHDKNW